jgi:hypothetical protein
MNLLRTLMTEQRTDFVSRFERGERQFNTALARLLATFDVHVE